MAATNTLKSTKLDSLIARLKTDYGSVKFKRASRDYWSPSHSTIYYNPNQGFTKLSHSLLHELAHSQLEHQTYESDFELLRLEAAAWGLTQKIGAKYGVKISDEHIQNCLDTYRDWLFTRSRCPTCSSQGTQADAKTYQCINCGAKWQVTAHLFTRPYRNSARGKVQL